MIYSVAQYMLSVEHLDIMSRRLASMGVTPLRDEAKGRALRCRVGNSAVVFEVMHKGVHSALRVYTRPHRNLRAIYGEQYLPKELLVGSSSTQSGYVDVVLCRWYEGETLQSKMEQLYGDGERMSKLSHMFDELALSILNEPWAHGDLKPENIVLGCNDMHLIDFDAMYRPGMKAEDCEELGTTPYQHPRRDAATFGKAIDDYPIALISTALAAMALDSTLGRAMFDDDALLIRPELAVVGKDAMLDRVERLFAERGDARHLHIAKLLRSSTPALPQLKSLLDMRAIGAERGDDLVAEYYNGSWGYARNGEFVIPPYFDVAFDFSEGLGLVRIADVWHFVDERGDVAITCGRGSGIKPLRNGVARIRRDDGEFLIRRDGTIERVER